MRNRESRDSWMQAYRVGKTRRGMPSRRAILAALGAASVPVFSPFLAGAARSAAAGSPGDADMSGSPQSEGAAIDPALSVVATTGMIADAVLRVGGGLVEVRALMGPGLDPHAYRQTRTDIAAMARADITFWHGLYLEAQMEDFFLDLARRRRVVAVTDPLPRNLLRAHDNYGDRYDPHVWMAPSLWARVVRGIEAELSAAHPEGAATFSENATRYIAELGALETYAAVSLGAVPESSRVLVTAHDAFGYFGDRFGFEVLGIQGISTQSEPGLARIAELVDTLVDRRIGAVFVESSVSDRNMRALIEGASARGHDVSIGGELYSDAMGPEGTYEGTYVGMIDHNATTIARALGATGVPVGGMSGRLAARKAEAGVSERALARRSTAAASR